MDITRSEKPQNNDEKSDGATNKGGSQKSDGNSSQSGMAGPLLVIFGLIVVAVVLVFAFENSSSQSGPVAMVGETAIERSEFNQQIDTLRSATTTQAQQFQQLSETRQQSLVLRNLIDQQLLIQAATDAGVSVSDTELDTQIGNQIEQIGGEEEFQGRLQENDLTREEVRDNLRNQLLVSQYVQQEAGTTTDQQIQQLYNQYTSQLEQAGGTSTNQQIPSLEQLRPQLEASIQQQNRRQLLQQARESINVEVMLEGVSYPPEAQTPQQQGAQQQAPQPRTDQAPQQQPSTSTEGSEGATSPGTSSPEAE
jgi:FKBP-type peptidyl-prolyl cis-trans isomerase (trigger factor)